MTFRLRSLAFVLAGASLVATTLAAGAPPIAVQQRVLVMPKLPAGADVPANLPEDGAVKMPFVTGGAPGVAARINTAVWHAMLDGADVPTTSGKTFTPRPDKLPQGTSSLDYVAHLIPAADPRLLALDFSGEGCGAYCESFTTLTHVYDLRDGREIVLGDLLTIDGFAALARRVDADKRHAYQVQVRELRAAVKSAPKGKKKSDDDDDAVERLTFNETCLKQVDSEPAEADWLSGAVFALDGQGGIAVSVGRCSNHAMQGIDDVGDITVKITPSEIRPWLTPYGLAVIRHEGDAPAPAAFAGRELHGRLAGMAITMKFDPPRDGAETRGTYAYDKFHTPIALAVRKDNEELRAVEQTDSRGEFELRPAGGTLVGSWQAKGRGKRLPVILQ